MDDAREWLVTARTAGPSVVSAVQPGDPWGVPLRSAERAAAEVTTIGAARPGGVWARALALAIDALVVAVISLGGTLGRGLGAFVPRLFLVGEALAITWAIFAPSAYFVLSHGTGGQTLGKRLLGLQVVDQAGSPIGYGHALGRYAATVLAALPGGLGLLLAGFRADRRGLHDLLAGTRVVRVR